MWLTTWFLFCNTVSYTVIGWLNDQLQKRLLGSMESLFLQLIVTLFFSLSFLNKGNAGITSSFVRSEWPSIDIPVDNEVFAVPKGHNAPQQVRTSCISFDYCCVDLQNTNLNYHMVLLQECPIVL